MSDDGTEIELQAVTGEPFYVAIEKAMLLTNRGEFGDALNECETAIRLDPKAAEPYFAMGVIAMISRDEGQALRMLQTAHDIDPETREYAEALGIIHTRVGQLADGLYFSKIAMGLEPHPLLSQRMPAKLRDLEAAFADASPSMHGVEAERLFNAAQYDLAAREAEAEIKLNPRNKDVFALLGRINHVLGRFERAVGAYHAASHLDPKDGLTPAGLARALVALGRFEEAAACARHALRCAPDDPSVFAQAFDALLRCPQVPRDVTRQLAVEHRERVSNALADDLAPPRTPGEGKIRVGLLSNAFFQCPAAVTIMTWLRGAASARAAFRGYAVSIAKDTVTTTIRDICEEWRDVYDIDPFTLGLTLKSEALDVFVDLSTPDGDTRFGAATMDPAPVRVGALALPEPGLAPGITHVLTDETLAQVDRPALLDGQQLLEIPGTLFACEPFDTIPQDLPLPSDVAGHVTFGGLAELSRLTPDCANLWADVLRNVAGSRLLLCSMTPVSNAVRGRVVDMFSHFGVADRLLFPTEDEEAEPQYGPQTLPLTQLEAIDVFLDTAPFNGQRELAMALWAGIPVVSLMGDRRPGATGASILAAARRVGWIARDRDDFVRIAGELASDTAALAETRGSLQANVAGSLLFDTAGTGRNVVQALLKAGKRGRTEDGKS